MQLVLQRFRPGRDDDLAPGDERRNQIGECLAGARSRLHGERPAPFDRLEDRARHLDLLGPGTVALDLRRQRTVGGEDAFQRAQFGTSSTFTQMRRETPLRASRPERTPDCSRDTDPTLPPISNHSPSRPVAVVDVLWPWTAPPRA